jgi:RNA-directed DNA polymerase
MVEDVVRPRMKGKATLVRFADDFVMTFETYHDAKRVMEVLGKRLDRFGLMLHPDKTHFIDFRPPRHGGTPPDLQGPIVRLPRLHPFVGKVTEGQGRGAENNGQSRIARSRAAVKTWCRTNRHRPAREQRAYYGITGNIRWLQEYRHQVVRIWHKWLERRTRGRTFTWDNFNAFLTCHPLPAAKIIHLMERISRARNRMPELRTSDMGGEGGNRLAYPAYYGPNVVFRRD